MFSKHTYPFCTKLRARHANGIAVSIPEGSSNRCKNNNLKSKSRIK